MNTINFKFENETLTLTMTINEIEVGFIELGGEEIMYSEIQEEFQGKGYYKMMLIAVFNMSNKQVLYSFNRNHNSNPVYEKWTNTELNEDDVICVCVDNEDLEVYKQPN